MDNGVKSNLVDKENSYQDQFKICKKNNISQLSKLGNNFATEDLRQNIDAELAKKHASPLDIYGESATFDEFCKSINGKFNTSMIKGAKNKRILIPKNSIKTPSKSSENKNRKRKQIRKGAESCRIEKYLKNAEKFSYPGSSLSIQHPESTQFATIDSNKMKIFKKNKIINNTNISKKIKKKKKYISSMKSGEYQMSTEINLTNCKNFDRVGVKGLSKSKCIPVKSNPPNNSKKRSSSKSKSKGAKAKYQLSTYSVKAKKASKGDPGLNGLSTREKSSKLSNLFDFNLVNNFKSVPKEKVKKRSLEKKAFKKLNFKKKIKPKNSTFDFTNFQSCGNSKKKRAGSKSKSKERQFKDCDSEVKEITYRTNGHKKSYYIPVTATHRMKDGKSTRSNSRTKTVSIKKVKFIKNVSSNLNIYPKMVILL